MRFLVFSIFALAAACAPPPAQPPEPSQHVTAPLLRPDQRTILDGPEALKLAHQCSRVSPGPVQSQWTPTEAQIAALEPTLASVIATHLQAEESKASPGDYYRQYAGFVIRGRRVIYINGVDHSMIEQTPNPAYPFDWRTQAVEICDGGSITFGVEYDVESGYFSIFQFNGPAGL
jgi:hypothetical protein